MSVRALVAVALLSGCSANDDVPAPLVATVVPDRATTGSLVVVSGTYFCQRPGMIEDSTCPVSGTVRFGTSPGTPTTWSDTSITVEVPAGVAGIVDLSVTAAGRMSNSISFTAD